MAETKCNESLALIKRFINEFRVRVGTNIDDEFLPRSNFPSFAQPQPLDSEWMQENYERFLHQTPNESLIQEGYLSEMGYITAVVFVADGEFLAVAHSTGLVQILAESTTALDQLPDKRELDGLHVQFFGETNIVSAAAVKTSAFVTSRSAALSLGVSADGSRVAVGYADTSIKIYDMQTQESIYSYKVHKMRLNFTAKKLQRMHTEQVCALVCHPEQPHVLASGAWDQTLRIWDTRCRVGCMMTFEGVNICGNSLDLNRDFCLAGSWQPLDALSLWDLRAKKRISIINAQNRRPDVDGEYIYACQFWRSDEHNRKGKYGMVGGSGTGCVEVVNLHNRYVACSYPAHGTVLAVASHGDSIAYGGTAPVFSLVSFHDPKHEGEAYAKAQVEADEWRDIRCFETENGVDLDVTHEEETEVAPKEDSVTSTVAIHQLQE